jgi:hypothetical protein
MVHQSGPGLERVGAADAVLVQLGELSAFAGFRVGGGEAQERRGGRRQPGVQGLGFLRPERTPAQGVALGYVISALWAFRCVELAF